VYPVTGFLASYLLSLGSVFGSSLGKNKNKLALIIVVALLVIPFAIGFAMIPIGLEITGVYAPFRATVRTILFLVGFIGGSVMLMLDARKPVLGKIKRISC
jgi:hypothetical protein